jgi:hypothetical protein
MGIEADGCERNSLPAIKNNFLGETWRFARILPGNQRGSSGGFAESLIAP